MIEGLRKFILGETAIIALLILGLVLGANTPSHVCYAIAGVGTGVSIANALKSKNGKN